MSIHLDLDNERRNQLANEMLSDLIEIAKLKSMAIKKMKADQNGVFYVEQEISIDDLLKQF